MRAVVPDELQVTYEPGTARFAFWATDDPGEALRDLGFPEGAEEELPIALPEAPNSSRAVATSVLARFVPLATAVSALANDDHIRASVTFRVWREAARLARGGACWSDYAALAQRIPPAGHAVLLPDKRSVPTAEALLTEFRTAVELAIESPVQAKLREYQEHGVAWLRTLPERGGGGILADEMGLGKTLQAICLMAARASERPHLVVCPTSLLRTWERELARFAPQVPVVPFHGSRRRLEPDAMAGGSVVVTSYALLRRESELLRKIDWDVVVADEAQQIKNSASQANRVARHLNARLRLAMTGTPVENRLDDLWSIMAVTNPGLLGTRSRFRARFATPIEQRRSIRSAQRLSSMIEPFVLRRTKGEVAADLPAKQHVLVACTLTREQAALYRQCVAEAFDAGLGTGTTRRGRVLALLTRLKQICNHPAQFLGESGPLAGRSGKLDRTAEIVEEIADAGERALVFTQYTAMGELLAEHLGAQLGHAVPFLHGGLSSGRRDQLVTRFQESDDAAQVMVLSLRAAGYGLTLTRASHVLHYDRWWNPAVEDQASDRAHRIGQTRRVLVHTLLTDGTVEEHITRMHEQKRDLASLVTGRSEAAALADLPDRDLRELLELTSEGENG
ncbi:DEAD/DEAH box helicase [Saccharopolyspora phatthalungensis]|uniref:SNF2 family DNA or RNA helicase n=1 Tax=Saccharopolyspora phatthalungensis TaxID=664693 RepID=A0A840Q5H8_9PSEU|nr:DEAD/DEAH box helicase [Saccharopolyspora phatthalungensis]MBB5153625.1 SNF2 family DNA or RNA helicase [Saccharopolyspora phatthalungensis]